MRSRSLTPLAFLLSLTLLGGCATVEVSSSNLDALLDDRDQLRHVAEVQSGWRYYLSALFPQQWLREDSILQIGGEVPVGDPSLEALENLLVLREGGGRINDFHREIEQVRHLARYAARCPGRLTRERAVLELAPHALRLAVEAPARPPENAANAAELVATLGGLLQAAEPVVLQGSETPESQVLDLAAACDLVAERELDLDGLWRALRTLGGLAARVDFSREVLAPLGELSRNLQARAVAQAYWQSAHDPHPFVRAAHARSAHSVWGAPYLAEALVALADVPSQHESERFDLPVEYPGESEVFVTVFDLIRIHGLPVLPELDPLAARRLRREFLNRILDVAYNFELFAQAPRVMAMRALGEVSGADFHSLRKEDWEDWWAEFDAEELRYFRAAEAAAEGES